MGIRKKIIEFRCNTNKYVEFIGIFAKKLRYLEYKLNYPEAYSDLLIYLYELLLQLNLEKFDNDLNIKKYIYVCLNNRFNLLYKHHIKEKYNFNINIMDIQIKDTNDYFADIVFFNLISTLTEKQKLVIYYKFYLNYSDVEIARYLNISRQAVNKIKRNALSKLKLQLDIKGE